MPLHAAQFRLARLVSRASVSRRCHNSFESHQPNPDEQLRTDVTMCGRISQVVAKFHVPRPVVR
jgi:hypothetical protein